MRAYLGAWGSLIKNSLGGIQFLTLILFKNPWLSGIVWLSPLLCRVFPLSYLTKLQASIWLLHFPFIGVSLTLPVSCTPPIFKYSICYNHALGFLCLFCSDISFLKASFAQWPLSTLLNLKVTPIQRFSTCELNPLRGGMTFPQVLYSRSPAYHMLHYDS